MSPEERIGAAFDRYNTRDREDFDLTSTKILCRLLGALETIVGSTFIEVTAERVAGAVETAVDGVLTGGAS